MKFRAEFSRPIDLAIPLRFSGPQPSFFASTPASARALCAGDFTGEVRRGASCNCSTLTLAPHCHGTHTECVGHVTDPPLLLSDLPVPPLRDALLVSVTPADRDGERCITRELLAAAAALCVEPCVGEFTALVVRTLPNGLDKRERAYRGPSPAPWFEPDAMHWIVEHGVESLVVDLPSLDRAEDGGALQAHRIYWGLPPGATDPSLAARAQALVTEFAFIADSVRDGRYVLNLQFPAFASDAAPSRPVLYPVQEQAA